MNKCVSLLVVLSLVVATNEGWSSTVFVVDGQGDVVQYDTMSNSLSLLGSLEACAVGLVQGLAYDFATDSLIIPDRNGSHVFSMDAQTGASSFLFSVDDNEYEGGAVKDGLLYMVHESLQTVETFDLATGANQQLSGDVFPDHTHGLGIDPGTGQLYGVSGNGDVRPVGDDGTVGSVIVTGSLPTFYRDVDYLDGDFVVTQPGRGIDQIDGTTGETSVLLSLGDLLAIPEFDGGVGIAVRPDEPAAGALPELADLDPNSVPEPTSALIFGSLMACLVVCRYRSGVKKA